MFCFKDYPLHKILRLKSKMFYSLVNVDGEKIKKAKGANKNVVKKIRHKEYVDVLFNKKNNKRCNEENSRKIA